MEVAGAHRDDTLGEGRDDGADDLRTRLLQRLGQDPDAEVQVEGLLGRDLEPSAFAHKGVRGFAFPDGGDDVDGLGEHLVAVLVQDPQRLGIRRQRPGADAEDEPAVGEVVEHRGVRRDQNGVLLGEVRRAGAEPDLVGLRDQRGQENQAVGDGLVAVGEVLADERVVVSQAVGQQHGLPVLAQRFRPVPAGGVQGHGEVAESHDVSQGPKAASVSGVVREFQGASITRFVTRRA